eukprot:m.7707 g.7707  ORF g.7707 m.7707 type:complete len:183 (+) comp2791_c0_seq1:52-600(+)
MPPLLVPPFRFSTVEPTLYRSAQPVPRNYEFLKTLGLKTVVALTPKEDKEFRRFADDEDIVVRHLTVKQACENVTLLPEQALLFLELVLNAENHPILVHCVNGTNTTGLVIAAVRKLQNISPAFAIAEFCRFTEYAANGQACCSSSSAVLMQLTSFLAAAVNFCLALGLQRSRRAARGAPVC